MDIDDDEIRLSLDLENLDHIGAICTYETHRLIRKLDDIGLPKDECIYIIATILLTDIMSNRTSENRKEIAQDMFTLAIKSAMIHEETQ